MIRVSLICPNPFGRNAVSVPQQAKRNSNGIVAGTLAVG